MNAIHRDQWQWTLTKTQQYLRNRIIGNGCERDQVEAWRHFYRTNDPVVRWMITKSGIDGKDRECVEAVWLDLIANLNTLRSPQTYDSFLYWLKKIVHSHAHQHRMSKPEIRQLGAKSPPSSSCKPAEHVPSDISGNRRDDEDERKKSANLNDRLLHLRMVEAQPVDRVARTLGLSCQQVIERQRVILKRILSVLIRLDIAPAGSS